MDNKKVEKVLNQLGIEHNYRKQTALGLSGEPTPQLDEQIEALKTIITFLQSYLSLSAKMPKEKQEYFVDNHGAFTEQFNRGYNQARSDMLLWHLKEAEAWKEKVEKCLSVEGIFREIRKSRKNKPTYGDLKTSLGEEDMDYYIAQAIHQKIVANPK